MDIGTPFLCLNLSADQASQMVTERLKKLGINLIRTFDYKCSPEILQSSDSHPGDDDRIIVFLIHHEGNIPFTLSIHGRGNRSFVSISQFNANPTHHSLLSLIQQAICCDDSRQEDHSG